jgi:hypothetical protein
MPKVDADWMASVGPWADCICGTNGYSTSLNTCYTAGYRKIIIADGAVLTANLTITGNDGFLWGPGRAGPNLGAYYIWIQGNNWHVEGFKLSGATSTLLAFTTSSAACSVRNMTLTSGSSHGIFFETTGNDHLVEGCYIEGNGGDGVKIGSGASGVRVVNNFIYNNSGWGVNCGTTSAIVALNRIGANTSGQITGTPIVAEDDDDLNILT